MAVNAPNVAGITPALVGFAADAMYGAEVQRVPNKAVGLDVCIITPRIVESVALQAK
jgi:hypothetical protein